MTDTKASHVPDEYYCDRCNVTTGYHEMSEHQDWHLAQDLQSQEDEGVSSTAPPPAAAPTSNAKAIVGEVPSFTAPSGPLPKTSRAAASKHMNQVTKAAETRARDEQQMQNMLQNVQFQYRIYNNDIIPEHETDYPCYCGICQYQRAKWGRTGVQDMWSKAVVYPGELQEQTVHGLSNANTPQARISTMLTIEMVRCSQTIRTGGSSLLMADIRVNGFKQHHSLARTHRIFNLLSNLITN